MRKSTLLLVLLVVWYSTTEAKVIRVPADYLTIQQGIDAASYGDTVLVAPGTYYEHIDFKGKAVVVKSTSGYAQTTIDGSNSGTVVKFMSNENSRAVIEGSKITNGSGILITSSPTIKNNWVVKNDGAGITVLPLQYIPFPTITNNIIEGNSTAGISAGATTRGPTIPYISHNVIKGNAKVGINLVNCWSNYSGQPTIFNNLITEHSGGIQIIYTTSSSADPMIRNNTIVNNTTAGIYVGYGYATIDNCIIWGNDDDLYLGPNASPRVQYSNIEDGDYKGSNGNISLDPLFVTGPQGQHYLSQTSAGQAEQSPCVDSGSQSAIALGLQGMTTRTDEVPDAGQVDMGYHFTVSTLTSVKAKVAAGIPEIFRLSQNFPNPFNPETMIQYQLPKQAEIRLEIYNTLGELVRTLVNEKKPAGYYTARWNGKDEHGLSVASGVYMYRLTAGEFLQMWKMLLVR